MIVGDDSIIFGSKQGGPLLASTAETDTCAAEPRSPTIARQVGLDGTGEVIIKRGGSALVTPAGGVDELPAANCSTEIIDRGTDERTSIELPDDLNVLALDDRRSELSGTGISPDGTAFAVLVTGPSTSATPAHAIYDPTATTPATVFAHTVDQLIWSPDSSHAVMRDGAQVSVVNRATAERILIDRLPNVSLRMHIDEIEVTELLHHPRT